MDAEAVAENTAKLTDIINTWSDTVHPTAWGVGGTLGDRQIYSVDRVMWSIDPIHPDGHCRFSADSTARLFDQILTEVEYHGVQNWAPLVEANLALLNELGHVTTVVGVGGPLGDVEWFHSTDQRWTRVLHDPYRIEAVTSAVLAQMHDTFKAGRP